MDFMYIFNLMDGHIEFRFVPVYFHIPSLVYFFLLAAFLSASFYIFVFSFVVHVPQFSQILRFSDFLNSLLFKIFRFSNFFILCSRL